MPIIVFSLLNTKQASIFLCQAGHKKKKQHKQKTFTLTQNNTITYTPEQHKRAIAVRGRGWRKPYARLIAPQCFLQPACIEVRIAFLTLLVSSCLLDGGWGRVFGGSWG